LDFILH